MDESFACMQVEPDHRSWLTKLRDRMFPVKHCFAPDAPWNYKDCVNTTSVCYFGFFDRIRILITGVVVVHTRTITQNVVGNAITAGESYPGIFGRDKLPEMERIDGEAQTIDDSGQQSKASSDEAAHAAAEASGTCDH